MWHVSRHSVSIILVSNTLYNLCVHVVLCIMISDSTRGKRVTFGSTFDESSDGDDFCEVEPPDDSGVCICNTCIMQKQSKT